MQRYEPIHTKWSFCNWFSNKSWCLSLPLRFIECLLGMIPLQVIRWAYVGERITKYIFFFRKKILWSSLFLKKNPNMKRIVHQHVLLWSHDRHESWIIVFRFFFDVLVFKDTTIMGPVIYEIIWEIVSLLDMKKVKCSFHFIISLKLFCIQATFH